MTDRETIEIYNQRAADYAELTHAEGRIDPSLAGFIAALPAGGHVLDLGCGPGNAAAALVARGFTVEAVDASSEMVALAAQAPGVTARVATFDEIGGQAVYDGIWANFSLLHAPRADMPRHLAAIHTALKPGGVFHIGMKLGDDSARDGLGRFYTYYAEDELTDLLEQIGFAIDDRRHGRDKGLDGTMDNWICLRAHKA